MDRNTVLELAPQVVKRMEYGIDRFYLLNFKNDEIWVGNYASYLIVAEIDGIKTFGQIINSLQPTFENYSSKELYSSATEMITELLEKEFLVKNKEGD